MSDSAIIRSVKIDILLDLRTHPITIWFDSLWSDLTLHYVTISTINSIIYMNSEKQVILIHKHPNIFQISQVNFWKILGNFTDGPIFSNHTIYCLVSLLFSDKIYNGEPGLIFKFHFMSTLHHKMAKLACDMNIIEY